MSQRKILLIDADGDCEEFVARAAARSGHRVQWVQTSKRAFEILADDLAVILLVIVDVDPGAHGLALLEGISACADRPAMIVVTALEEGYMAPIAHRHGAVACIGKPLELEKFSAVIKDTLKSSFPTADKWGHLKPTSCEGPASVRISQRGIAAKLGCGKLHQKATSRIKPRKNGSR